VLGLQKSIIELGVVQCLHGGVALQNVLERREVAGLEHVHDEGFVGGGELQEAHPSVPGREVRGLDVQANDFGASESLRDGGELGGF
jgi:hypothetical protein